MISFFLEWFQAILRTISQILMAGVAITAFSMLLYALAFNLRDRVARTFAIIMACVVVVFTAESLASTNTNPNLVGFFLRAQWIGIIMLPPIYLQFSNALLETTGRPSRGKRLIAIVLANLISLMFLVLIPLDLFVGPVVYDSAPAPHLEPKFATYVFSLYYLVFMAATWFNFSRSYRRSQTTTSRRRMGYLITGALAPVIGSFPFLLFGSGIIKTHTLIFWFLSAVSNTVVLIFIVVMAYAVAFFGTPWPDRVVKSRLFKWLMRGPATAAITLGVVTVTRRLGVLFGEDYSVVVPIVMVSTILLLEYLITLFAPLGERFLFWGIDREDLQILRRLEDRLLTRTDGQHFLDMVLAGVCDRLQSKGAYIAVINPEGINRLVMVGKPTLESMDMERLNSLDLEKINKETNFRWGNDLLIPLVEQDNGRNLIGLMGISDASDQPLDEDAKQALQILAERATLALRDRRLQEDIFTSIQEFSPDMEVIEQLRASARYGNTTLLTGKLPQTNSDMALWVRDALVHYWGGPRLTDTPLMKLKVVQDALKDNNGNQSNAMRLVLRQAVERVRPQGERRFTADWILYNILELKFLEGKKVREVALRLAMSEADLYRKQRIAIEAVAKEIMEMENQTGNAGTTI